MINRMKNANRIGSHYHTTTVRQKKKIIREIQNTLRQQPAVHPLTVCKMIVDKNKENRANIYKYYSWWEKRNGYLNMKSSNLILTR